MLCSARNTQNVARGRPRLPLLVRTSRASADNVTASARRTTQPPRCACRTGGDGGAHYRATSRGSELWIDDLGVSLSCSPAATMWVSMAVDYGRRCRCRHRFDEDIDIDAEVEVGIDTQMWPTQSRRRCGRGRTEGGVDLVVLHQRCEVQRGEPHLVLLVEPRAWRNAVQRGAT